MRARAAAAVSDPSTLSTRASSDCQRFLSPLGQVAQESDRRPGIPVPVHPLLAVGPTLLVLRHSLLSALRQRIGGVEVLRRGVPHPRAVWIGLLEAA